MYKDLKVTSGEVAANNVKSAPDRLQGTATENKNIFDKLVELFVGKYNSLLDELDDNEIKTIDPITINGYTISHANSGVTQGMYGTDQEQDPQHGEKFIVPYIIVDEHGHIVSAGNSEVQLPSGGGGGTTDYDDLTDKPSINSVILQGNKTSSDLSLASATHTHTKSEITDFPALATVATTGDYDDLSDKPSIPTKTSDLTNDSGFIDTETDPVFTASDAYGITSSDISNWNGKSDFSGDYNDLTNKPTIPAKNTWYATCSTGASTTAKTAISQTADFTLATGNMVRVLFTNTNTATSPTISIDGSTAKNIRIRSGSTGAMTYMWRDNEVVDLVYDGTNFVMSDGAIATTTYYGITSLSSSTSSTSETESATPKAVKTAYDLANGKADAVHTHTKSDITDFPTIPTKVSDLTNDSGFSSVSFTRYTTSGTNIADIDIDGTTTKIYAPTSGGGGVTDYDQLTSRPQVNSATLTGNKSSSDLGVADEVHTHTKSDITDFPTIPSKTSDLTNDSGYITGYTETDPVFSASAAAGITSSDISTWNGKSDFSGSYNDLTNKPTIPSKTSDLTNDSGYITTETDPTVPSWAKASTKPTYTASEVGALPNTTVIPTKTSDLTNDSRFISANSSGNVSLSGSITTGGHNNPIGYTTGPNTGTWSVTNASETNVPSANLTPLSLTPGVWIVFAQADFSSNATGRRFIEITTSVSGHITRSGVMQNAVSGGTTKMVTTAYLNLSNTQTVTIRVFQNSGAARSTTFNISAVRIA